MAKLLKGIICFSAVITLLSCSNTTGSEEILVRKLTGDEKLTFTDKKTIETIEQAIKSAERLPGIVNVVFADFRVVDGDESYDLWLRGDTGTIMNLKDTHTVYSLTAKSAKELHRLLEPIIDSP